MFNNKNDNKDLNCTPRSRYKSRSNCNDIDLENSFFNFLITKDTLSVDKNTFKDLYNKRSVFNRSKKTLDKNYVPEKLIQRKDILKKMLSAYRGIIEGEPTPISCVLLGKGGVGKTTTARFFARNFRDLALDYNVNLVIEYYNCVTFRSKSTILRALLSKISHGSGRGYADDEALKYILTSLVRSKQKLFLIIDEVHLLGTDEIYSILNIAETFSLENSNFSLLLISRKKDWMLIENERISSRVDDKIILEPYNFEHAFEILKYRAEYTFKEDVVNDDLLTMVAQTVVDTKNMRHGIQILRRAGNAADSRVMEHINGELIREASEDAYPNFRADIIDDLNEQELFTLYGVTKSLNETGSPYTTVDDAYAEYKDVCGKYNRVSHVVMSFRKYIRNLSSLKIISSKSVRASMSDRGRRLEVTLLDIPVSKLLEFLTPFIKNRFS